MQRFPLRHATDPLNRVFPNLPALVAEQIFAMSSLSNLETVNRFFEQPILNSPYDYPERHWELDGQGQPTQRLKESRRRAEFITPIPKPRKRKGSARQEKLIFDEGKGLSTKSQQYDPTSIINALRLQVDKWRKWPNQNDWRVTPETGKTGKGFLEHLTNANDAADPELMRLTLKLATSAGKSTIYREA